MSEPLADEIRDLRRTIRDLVALSMLPAVWPSYGVRGIVESLADVLLGTLQLDLVYIRMPRAQGKETLEVVRCTHPCDALGEVLAPWLHGDRSNPPRSIPHPFGSGELPVALVRFGQSHDPGILFAGCRRPDFPTESDRLLLSVGTNQMAITLEHRRAEEALRDSEARFRFLAETIPSIVWTAAPDGTITYVNQRWLQYCGLTAEQNARNWPELVLHPDDHERCVAQWTQCLAEGKEYEIEVRNRRHDGVYRWFITRAVPRHDFAGRVVSWFGVTTDIHDQKTMQEQLRDADRRKDEFLATLAHELRNPLAPIRNALQLLQMSEPEEVEDNCQELQEIMDRQVRHLVRLVDDLLEVSRITRGKIELRKEVVELAHVVHNAVETSRPLLETANHRLTVTLPPEPLFLEADPVRLSQVLANLLNNAAKYTESGGCITLSAERELSSEREEVVLRVRDNGIGIPREMHTRVFEMFTQVDRSLGRAQGGLGIGLSLVRSLVELHGGSVAVTSDGTSQGSEFTVRLPLRPVEVERGKDRRRKDAASLLVRPPAFVLPSLEILVVDDIQDGARTLGTLLKRKGHHVRLAYDGPTALEALGSYRPSVVLTDLGMPGMDGYEVARRVRQEPKFDDVVLIALTGWGQEEDRRRTHAAGFNHHLVKPVDLDDLEAFLLSHFESRNPNK